MSFFDVGGARWRRGGGLRATVLCLTALGAGAFCPAPALAATGDAADAGVVATVPSAFRLRVPRLASRPVIDGRLDDGAWAGAAVLGDFVQTEPEDGAPATRRTEVRVGYDARALYVAFRCEWASPREVVALSMNHDAYLDVEDHVEVALDTFQDRQNAFLFRTNPLGVRVEGIIRDNGEDVRYDWDDPTWEVATTRDERGWTAELAIPFGILRFADVARPVFGVNFGRFVAAAHEVSYWKHMPYTRGVWSSRYKVAGYGELTGLEGLQRGNLFDARPYLFAGLRQQGTGPYAPLAQFGLDVKIPLTTSLVADLTVNPDFADAEADEQQLNLTRFPLLLPEKREFFKEGASLFYFGDRVVDTSNETLEQFIFFQSRQVGLARSGQATVPVLGGARVTGKVGDLNVGLLNLTSPEVNDPATAIRLPLQNDTVLRLRYDFANSSSVGLMALNRQRGDGSFNRGLGLDGNLVVTDWLRFGGYLAKTFTHDVAGSDLGLRAVGEGDDWAGSADAVVQTGLFSLHALYTDLGPNFRPDLGYLTRPGIRKFQAVPILTWSPGFWGIKHASVIYDFNLVLGRDWSLQTMLNKPELLVTFNNGYAFAIIPTVDQQERLESDFAVTGDLTKTALVIPANRKADPPYDFRSLFFGFGTDLSAPYAGIIWLDGGSFYTGTRFRVRLNLFARPLPGLGVQAIYDREQLWLPAADYTSHIVSVVGTWALTPSLSSRLTFQYASGQSLRANLLVSWTFPAASFWLVVDKQADLVGGRPWLDALTVAVKLNFTWGPAAPVKERPEVALGTAALDGRGCGDSRLTRSQLLPALLADCQGPTP